MFHYITSGTDFIRFVDYTVSKFFACFLYALLDQRLFSRNNHDIEL